MLGALPAFLGWQRAIGIYLLLESLEERFSRGRVRAAQSRVRAHEISAAMRPLMSLAMWHHHPSWFAPRSRGAGHRLNRP
jgi:hypothetical protein